MGATVITGKRAAAFHKTDGELVYVLFERTYEKNVYPQPRSSDARRNSADASSARPAPRTVC